MDFSRQNAQPQAAPAPTAGHTSGGGARKTNKVSDDGKMARVGFVVAIAAVAILVAAVALFAAKGSDSQEDKYVDSSKLQAVFLNTGQVYFGKIKTLNNKYFVVSNIYYLQTSSGSTSSTAAAANTSVSLVKLGCELHEPYDQMVINRDQVTFWENLQDNGQVAQAVKTFVKQNPNGQKCADQSSAAGTTSGSSVQSAGQSGASTDTTTGAGTTGTTNKSTTTNP